MHEERGPKNWRTLSKPFLPEAVKLRVVAKTKDKTRGMVAPFVSARTVMKRLDDVFGIEGWNDRYESIGSTLEGAFVKCSLTIDGIMKEDIGSGTDYKSACSDSLKRAAVKFGIGRYLYDLPKPWVRLDDRGSIVNEEAVKARILGRAATEGVETNGATALDASSLRR